jgi:hypothetical protein
VALGEEKMVLVVKGQSLEWKLEKVPDLGMVRD